MQTHVQPLRQPPDPAGKGRFCFPVGSVAVALLFCAANYSAARSPTYEPCFPSVPPPGREFRAAWVATVGNIDWPSTNTLSSAQQKAELLAILHRALDLKLNAIIFQVRPACDALYASPIEPWSEYLTGIMGKAPEPFYDPLAFAIEEAHRRGLELHAWFNPYRARHSGAKSPISATHISKTHPELVRKYGRSLWLDPGEKQVQDYSLRVVLDVVRRYDIDGVHFDDYFYPYTEKDPTGNDLDFPDDASWRRFGAGVSPNRADWRRDNVNAFIHRVYEAIKAEKPWVKFGISPFGIWRPGYPQPIQGYDAYAKLYADSRKWLAEGWVDYFAPQLYWPIAPREQSFPVLLKWWTEQNRHARLLVPGLASANAGRRWKPEEIINQIRLTRKRPGTSGHIHWNMSALMRNAALDAALETQAYPEAALVPAMSRLATRRPEKPRLQVQAAGSTRASWAPGGASGVWLWVLQTRMGRTWTTEILPAQKTSRIWPGAPPEVIALSAIDRTGNLSRSSALKVKQ